MGMFTERPDYYTYYTELQAEKKKTNRMTQAAADALCIATQYGLTDGGHHKMWVIDQMIRALFEGDEKAYAEYIARVEAKLEDEWNVGIAP